MVATAASGGQQGSRCGRVDLRPVLAKDGRHELLLAPVRHLVEALLTSLLAIALGTAQDNKAATTLAVEAAVC